MNRHKHIHTRCKAAAVRAYLELREKGEGDVAAFDAAVHVFRLHHPEVPKVQALDAVSAWVDDAVAS